MNSQTGVIQVSWQTSGQVKRQTGELIEQYARDRYADRCWTGKQTEVTRKEDRQVYTEQVSCQTSEWADRSMRTGIIKVSIQTYVDR